MQVLIVDDDTKYLAFVSRGLSASGIDSDTATSGGDALARLSRRHYDLLLLDVMLPDLAGWDVLQRIRAAGRDVPVIWVTACDDVDDRIRGLRMGGDDYIVKPFVFEELLARMDAVVRRRGRRVHGQVGELDIDYATSTSTRAGVTLDLTPIEFRILCYLAERSGRPVSRRELLAAIWRIEFEPETNLLEVHIRRLRKKVDEPFDTPMIHTLRGSGYVLEAR